MLILEEENYTDLEKLGITREQIDKLADANQDSASIIVKNKESVKFLMGRGVTFDEIYELGKGEEEAPDLQIILDEKDSVSTLIENNFTFNHLTDICRKTTEG